MEETELKQKMTILGTLLKSMEDQKAEFEKRTHDLAEDIEAELAELKTEFLTLQESAESENLIVQFRKGAVRWDSTGLKKYAKVHPELLKFQTVGSPTVAFVLRKPEDVEEYEKLREL